MNETVEPCDDFYEYACGNWVASQKLTKGQEEISVFSKLSEEIDRNLEKILRSNESWMGNSTSSLPIEKARLFFKSCNDVAAIEKAGVQPLFDHIKTLNLPGFCDQTPSDPQEYTMSWKLHSALRLIHTTSFTSTAFFDIDSMSDYQDKRVKLIKIDDSGFSLQQEIYISHPKLVQSYKKYVHNVVRELGYTCDEANQRVEAILTVEENVAHFGSSKFLLESDDHQRLTIQELAMQIPDFPWLEHLATVFNDSIIGENETIFVSSISRLYYIVNLINKTPALTLGNYLLWHEIKDQIPYLSKKFRHLYDNFKNEIYFNLQSTEVDNETPRNTSCTEITNGYFGLAIAGDFINSNFGSATLWKAKTLLHQVVDTMKNQIRENDWLDNKTISKAVDKLDAMSLKVGYPEYIFNLTYLKQRYDDVEIRGDKFFANLLRLDKSYRKKYLQKLRQPLDREKWSMLPQTANAMYQFFQNDIVIPAGMLGPPFFYPSDELPVSLNYGSIGSVIGHEITHAFDSTGRKFDKNGLIVKEWWSGDAVQEFNQRAICIQEQYSRYKPNNKSAINGGQTLAENIADNGGLIVAFRAFETMKDSDAVYEIRGKNFTSPQLFFVAFAQGYCNKAVEEFSEMDLLMQSHSPSKYRVIGSLSNSEEFSRAFNCPQNSRMNPNKKCKIW